MKISLYAPERITGLLTPALALVLALAAGAAAAQQAPSVGTQSAATGETVGDASPVTIDLEPSTVPGISATDVAGRYQALLANAVDPEVRIDALHRLINLQGAVGDELDVSASDEQRLYRLAVESYEQLISSGAYQGPVDELLYQNAKAYAFIGEEERSITRLQQLVDAYPQSAYAIEARFRIAEYAFALGDFAMAEEFYSDVVNRVPDNRFADKAQYMLGWSQFKRDRRELAAGTFIAVLDRYAEREGGFETLGPVEANVVDDSFRILSIIAAYEGGPELFQRLLADRSTRPDYEYLLYDRLADYYLANEQYADSIATNLAFIDRDPAHPQSPALARQIVRTYEAGNFTEEALAARESFIDRFGSDERFEVMRADDQQALRNYLDHVGRHYYRRGQETSTGTVTDSASVGISVEGPSMGAESQAYYREAATYLERWTQLLDNGERGEQLVLAGDAWVRAGEPDRALGLYEIAGYREGGYEQGPDAAYAAVMIYRRRLEQASESDQAALEDLIAASDRYLRVHVEDERAHDVRAYTANLMFDRGLDARAEAMAMALTHDDQASAEQRRAGLLIVANAAYNAQDYEPAERIYQEALATMPAGSAIRAETADKLAASIYRQGEVAAGAGRADHAVERFLLVATTNEGTQMAMRARYDAANTLLAAKRWDGAIDALIDFQERYPGTDLAEGADDKLIHAYEASGDFGRAADTLLAQTERREMPAAERWEQRIAAAEWYEKAARDASARRVYRQYLAEGTDAFGSHEYQQELRWMLAERAGDEGDNSAAMQGYRQILASEEEAEGTDRSIFLAAQSALVLAQQSADAFRDIQLTEPLRESLGLKRSALEDAISHYERARQFGLADINSQATYAIAELYRTLAGDMLSSEPPSQLNDLQRQQYAMLLEEQAYPFEEEAIALHEQNQALMGDRLWTPWIGRSMESLAEIFPARYARQPRWLEWSSEEVSQ